MACKKNLALFVSEFLCTGLLVSCTCLARSATENSIMPMSIAFGIINLFLTYTFGQLSGGFANPSVVLALWWRGSMPTDKFLIFVGAEISGATVGHFVVQKLLSGPVNDTVCIFEPKADYSESSVLVFEFLLTFMLVMTWCFLWDYEGDFPLEVYIGGVTALIYLLGTNLTGGCTNPARTIAPLLFQKTKYIATGIIGVQLAAGLAAPILWNTLDSWTNPAVRWEPKITQKLSNKSKEVVSRK